MRLKHAKRRVLRTRTIESLEERRVMAADLLGQLFDGPIEQHAFLETPDLPALVHHAQPDADFWLDPWSEFDLETTLGDIEKTIAGAHSATGLTQVRNDYGFIGTGQTVAIIDSGIAWDHIALGGGFGPNYRVVGGWDFTEENDSNPYDDGPSGGHGTHVAGIVGADRPGTTDDGVAPGVDLVALRVFNDMGAGYFSWVKNALRWVHDNRDAFANPITAVNLSLGATWNSASIPAWATLEEEFALLKASGIFISVSAGNSFSQFQTPGLSYPAASPHVVPVMSVDNNGNMSAFSQRHPNAIAAPGRSLNSTIPDYIGNQNGIADDYANMTGTSMAAPYVAGASVLLREAMQFVGYANITQDTIFSHMMATATTFFDAATGLDYKRLNLGAALEALMPVDEYGSTAATAFNLGTLSGTNEVAGVINKLSDADYFTFTAAATGTVSFTATTTHRLKPVWTSPDSGGVVSGVNGETFTFEVVAGQSYTLGLSTSDGIGYYTLEIDAASEFTYVDWGAVTQSMFNGLASNGESWYRVEAMRTGRLTIESFFAAANGSVNLMLYDNNMQMVTHCIATETGARMDWSATGGDEYFICVSGTNACVDFRLTNLVSQVGSTVTIHGSAGDDGFAFQAGATHQVMVNGVEYSFAASSAQTFEFVGGEGNDTITIYGTTKNEQATLYVGSVEFVGSNLTVRATSVENVTVHGGGGNDTARFFDSAGNDVFTARPTFATLTGAGYVNTVFGFKRTTAYSESGGNDRAYLYGSSGNDQFIGRPELGRMTGSGFDNTASNFTRVDAYAMAGGNDRAFFYDSAGDDLYVARPDRAYIQGNHFTNMAWGFNRTTAYATAGGNDRAIFYDSAGNDTYYASPERAYMQGPGYTNVGWGFGRTTAHSTSGGKDRALFYDSAGNDTFIARPDRTTMQGDGFFNIAWGFGQSTAYATLGGDDRATFYDSTGDDVYVARPDRAYLQGNGITNMAIGFGHTTAYSAAGGSDRAIFYDSPGDDLYVAWPDRAYMQGDNFMNMAIGFSRTTAHSTAGGNDEAIFYDSPGNDVYNSRPDRTYMQGDGYMNIAWGFSQTAAHSTAGGNDLAVFYDSIGNDVFSAWADRAVMSGLAFRNEAHGFSRVVGHSSAGGSDLALLYNSTGDDYLLARKWGVSLSGQSFLNEARGFADVTAQLINGGNDTIDTEAVDYVFKLVGNA